MRIHYLSASKLPSVAANSVHVMKMCNAFARGRHDVTLFAYRTRSESELYAYYGVQSPFAIRPLPQVALPGLKRLSRTFAAARRMRRPPWPDLVYGRDLYSLLTAVGTNVPIVYEAHMPPQSRSDARLVGKLLEATNFARLVVISAALAKRFASLYPSLAPERIVVAHDAADEPAPAEAPSSAPADLCWPRRTGAMQVGYAGSLLPGKGADLVIALAKALPRHDFHLLGGSEADVRRIREQDGHGNLFAHGHVEHQRVAAYLRRMDVALLPAQRRVIVASGADIGEWMSPLKLFEYMACRLAIVASALPVVREVLVDGENAVLVPAGDLAGWAEAIERLARDGELRERLASRAFEDFHERHTWTGRSERVLAGLGL